MTYNHEPNPEVGCTCRELHLNTSCNPRTGVYNLDPDCPEHGYGSAWYNSVEQQDARAKQSARLRELQARATRARRRLRNLDPG